MHISIPFVRTVEYPLLLTWLMFCQFLILCLFWQQRILHTLRGFQCNMEYSPVRPKGFREVEDEYRVYSPKALSTV